MFKSIFFFDFAAIVANPLNNGEFGSLKKLVECKYLLVINTTFAERSTQQILWHDR